MKNPIKILITLLVIVIVLIVGWFVLDNYQGSQGVIVVTDKTDYEKQEMLRDSIENKLGDNICFSSCYPYRLEKRNENGEWVAYSYEACPKDDVNENCINSEQKKLFEINLFFIEEGTHRIVLPVCIDCMLKEEFKESKRFYSNVFEIK